VRFGEQDLDDQQSRTHHNGAIRQIEKPATDIASHRPAKIDHSPTGEAIPKVPQRPSHNQGQADAGDNVGMVVFPEQGRDND